MIALTEEPQMKNYSFQMKGDATYFAIADSIMLEILWRRLLLNVLGLLSLACISVPRSD
jgi:hypothetical protein